MITIYSGPAGSGKTSTLKKKYLQLIAQGVKSDEVLVLVRSATDVTVWRNALRPPAWGPLNIFTYFGFIQNQLAKFWPIVEETLPGGHLFPRPVFMNVEASHYFMGLLVEQARRAGGFGEVRSTAQEIAVQLIDNMNQGAVNGLDLPRVAERLHRLAVGSKEKASAYHLGVEVMNQFRRQCLENHCLDYSMMVELYNQVLLKNPVYMETIKNNWRYILVDDLEETLPVTQDLILLLWETCQECHLGYNSQGGHTVYFGAYPEGVVDNILPRSRVYQLNPPPDIHSEELARYLSEAIKEKPINPVGCRTLKGQIVSQMRGGMLEQVAEEVTRLVASGTPPGEIAIIAPVIDRVMEFTLYNQLGNNNIEMANVTRSKRLLDQPFAQAMVTLAVLANPQWKLELNFSALVQSLCLLLKLDPVRSAMLAEETFKNRLSLPDIDEVTLRERLGYSNSEYYLELQRWVEERRQNTPDLELLFQQAFGELLSPLLNSEEDLLACRQIIDSAVKLRTVLNRYGQTSDLGHTFIDMVQRGTLAADVLYRPPASLNKVILTNPTSLILNPFINKVKYQFWLDIGGAQWMRGLAKELSNPWVISLRWNNSMVWGDEVDQQTRVERLVLVVKALLAMCTGGVYTAHSHLNSQGWEQDSLLVDVFDSVHQGGIQNDKT